MFCHLSFQQISHQADENTTVTSFDVGDVDAALASSEAVVKGSIETTRQEHFYEETMVALVVPIGEDNEYRIYHPTPNILFSQHMVSLNSKTFKDGIMYQGSLHQVAKALGVPFNRVMIESKRVRLKGRKAQLHIFLQRLYLTFQIGCNYGGKATRFLPLLIATALASKLSKKPVRCQLTR